MAYTHVQREVAIATAASTASLAVIGIYTPGYMPVILRAVAMVFSTAAAAAGIMLVKRRPIPGSASGESTVATINFDGTSGAVGKVVYVDGLHAKFVPGEQICFEITDVAAAGVVEIKALVEETWEVPQNNTEMTETT